MNNEEKEAYNKAETEVKKSYEKQKEKALQEFEIQLKDVNIMIPEFIAAIKTNNFRFNRKTKNIEKIHD